MKYLDRVIWLGIVVAIAAGILPAAMPSITTAAVIGTVCFIAIRAALYFTHRW